MNYWSRRHTSSTIKIRNATRRHYLYTFIKIKEKTNSLTSLPLRICCTARTTANLPSNTKTAFGKQLPHSN